LRPAAQPDDKGKGKKPGFRAGAVRYQVKDVGKSVEFYTKHLGFKKEMATPAFGAVSNGSLTLCQRPEEFRFSRAARRPQAGAGRVEPDRPRSR
jgi:catechol 2,3-dioxygenase-like lactoylglutathione lyase family enzyme